MVSYGSVECRWNHHDVARGIAMIKPYLKLGIFSFFRGRSLLDKGLRCLTRGAGSTRWQRRKWVRQRRLFFGTLKSRTKGGVYRVSIACYS